MVGLSSLLLWHFSHSSSSGPSGSMLACLLAWAEHAGAPKQPLRPPPTPSYWPVSQCRPLWQAAPSWSLQLVAALRWLSSAVAVPLCRRAAVRPCVAPSRKHGAKKNQLWRELFEPAAFSAAAPPRTTNGRGPARPTRGQRGRSASRGRPGDRSSSRATPPRPGAARPRSGSGIAGRRGGTSSGPAR